MLYIDVFIRFITLCQWYQKINTKILTTSQILLWTIKPLEIISYLIKIITKICTQHPNLKWFSSVHSVINLLSTSLCARIVKKKPPKKNNQNTVYRKLKIPPQERYSYGRIARDSYFLYIQSIQLTQPNTNYINMSSFLTKYLS
jgi:hypothetical protein